MTREEFKIVKDYVENKLLKGINNLKEAKEVYRIIHKSDSFYAAGIDQAIFRWWSFNHQDVVLDEEPAPKQDDSKAILTKVGVDATTNFEGVKTHPTKSEDMPPEQQSHSEDSKLQELEAELESLEDNEENKRQRQTLKMMITKEKKKLDAND